MQDDGIGSQRRQSGGYQKSLCFSRTAVRPLLRGMDASLQTSWAAEEEQPEAERSQVDEVDEVAKLIYWSM